MTASILSDPALQPVLAALPAARLVGGCVRDTLAGLPVADIDLATPDPPDMIQDRLRAAGLRAVPTGLAHGTITAMSDGRGFEITTLRRDVATDGRHAVVAWTDDWQQDAARRDFTINAMSMDRTGRVFDYFGGEDDLKAGYIRFVGDAATRIAEDRLRVLRFFRFWARYGRISPGQEMEDALRATACQLHFLSQERVWAEFKRILIVPDPMAVVSLMDRTDILAALLVDGADIARLQGLAATNASADPVLRLAALAKGDGQAIATQFRLSNRERQHLLALQIAAPSADITDKALRRLLANEDADIVQQRIWIDGREEAERIYNLTPPPFPLQGHNLIQLGISPGPEIGRLLKLTRDWWLKGECNASLSECIDKVKENF